MLIISIENIIMSDSDSDCDVKSRLCYICNNNYSGSICEQCRKETIITNKPCPNCKYFACDRSSTSCNNNKKKQIMKNLKNSDDPYEADYLHLLYTECSYCNKLLPCRVDSLIGHFSGQDFSINICLCSDCKYNTNDNVGKYQLISNIIRRIEEITS